MIFIGTLFCNLLEDAMRLHLQPRLDMTSVLLAALPICMLYLACLHFTYSSLTSLTRLTRNVAVYFLLFFITTIKYGENALQNRS